MVIPVYQGETPRTISVTCKQTLPPGVDLSGATYNFMVFAFPDNTVKVQKTVSSGITVTDGATGALSISVGGNDLPEVGNYVGRVQVVTSGGTYYTSDEIYLEVHQRATKLDFLRDVWLAPVIGDFQYIRMTDDTGYPVNDGTVRFSYGNWVPTAWHEVIKNGVVLVENTDYTIDYAEGKITPTSACSIADTVLGRYVFKYFDNDELNAFFELVIASINFVPPRTQYTVDSITPEWTDLLLMGVYAKCLQRIIVDPVLLRHQPLFNNPAVTSALTAIYQQVTTDFKASLGTLKSAFRASPRVSRTAITSWRLYSRGYNWRSYVPQVGLGVSFV